MDALELLKTRRSVPSKFLGEPGPSEDELNELLTIAARVPDHGKLVPWRFVVYRGGARSEAGSALLSLLTERGTDLDQARMEEEQNRFSQAPVVVGVVSRAAPHVKIPEFEQLMSAAAATENLVIGAHALGYASQWLSGWFMFDDEAARILGARDGERFVGFVHIGTPEAHPGERPRPDLSDIVEYWKGI